MKAVLQRVKRASVSGASQKFNRFVCDFGRLMLVVDGEIISSIGRGLLVLIGIDKSGRPYFP